MKVIDLKKLVVLLAKKELLDSNQKKQLALVFKDSANVIFAGFVIAGFLDEKVGIASLFGGILLVIVMVIFSVRLSKTSLKDKL